MNPRATAAVPNASPAGKPNAVVVAFQYVVATVLVGLLLFGAGLYVLRYDIRSYFLLLEFLNPQASGFLVHLATRNVATQEVTIVASHGPVRGRMYIPAGIAHPHGMLLVHGIHHLGIDEPRLMRFAHAAATNGFAVLTPEVAALADYHVDSASISTIGDSAAWFEQWLGTGPVTVVGVSFAGGLSLLAARNPQYAAHFRSIVLMGAYDSLERTTRFLASSEAELPNGRMEPYKAHDYGAAVFVYSNLAQFFPASDLSIAHEALRDWLWEEPQAAEALLPQLSPASRETMEILLNRQIDKLRPRMLQVIQSERTELAELSPEGKLADLHTPIFVLHGETDDIIPSTESLWLEREIPKPYLREALITPAFSHVDPEKHPYWGDELQLVEFLAGVLRTADSGQ